MANQTVCCNSLIYSCGFLLPRPNNNLVSTSSLIRGSDQTRPQTTILFSAKSGGVSLNSIECPGCKGLYSSMAGIRGAVIVTPSSRVVPRQQLRVRAESSQEGPQKWERPPPGVDTRIHWDNEDDGWVGGATTTSDQNPTADGQKNILAQEFADLLNDSTDSHYQFLGISAEADLEEIKAAYRRLSKEYHPDTTSLPLKSASDKFLRLREVYDVLSNQETRRFYDWTLAQEVASRQAEKMSMKLDDPYVKDLENYVPVPDVIDRLDGKNLELSDQAKAALTIDALILVFTIFCIAYYLIFLN